ncbi:HIT domain-containing protein [Rhodobacterales bacterium HKCCE2091]|nr:HIT domain-containing protein [Rhodobacterales bacterium HKCCE2091]
MTCAFCAIAADPAPVAMVHEDADLMVFLDHMPIREGHCLIVPRAHYPYFDDLPETLAARVMALSQRLARSLKAIHGVERVAFFATGTDLPHAHIHVVPLHEKGDLTSARYMAEPPVFAGIAVQPREQLAPVADRLRQELETTA